MSSNSLALPFSDRLLDAVRARQTPLVVGIDPRTDQLPPELATSADASPEQLAEIVARYGIELIDVVADLVPAVKPQAAFFEQLGPAGCTALAKVVDHAKQAGLLVIMDAKRGDIGSTATAYAQAYLGPKPASAWGCDALTVNPYLGRDTLKPFVDAAVHTGSGLFVLAKTSNPGSDWIQGRESRNDGDAPAVYLAVARHLQELSLTHAGQSGYGPVGAVVGATYPEQLSELRSQLPNTLFLIPGFGAQGGTAADVAGGLDENGMGGLINSSRAIIQAYQRPEFASLAWTDAVRAAAEQAIQQIADATSAGCLRPGV